MAQPDAAEYVNEIAKELFSMTLTGLQKERDPFTKRRLERDIEKVVEPSKRLFLTGVLKMIYGEMESGITLCERAVQLDPNDPVMWNNYVIITRQLHSSAAAHEIRLRGLEHVSSPSFIFDTLVMQQQLNDFQAALSTFDKLEKVIGRDKAITLCNEQSYCTVDDMIELSEMPQAGIVKEVTCLMHTLAEKGHGYKIKEALSELEQDSDSYCIEMFIPDITLSELKNLNRELLKARRERGLATSQVVGLFREGTVQSVEA